MGTVVFLSAADLSFFYISQKFRARSMGQNKNHIDHLPVSFFGLGVLCLLVEFLLSYHVDKTQL